MRDFDKWTALSFYSFLVDTTDGFLLVNTGLPRDLSPRNKFLRDWAGTDRCKFSVSDEEKIENALARNDLTPDDIAHVIITPVQDYTIGALNQFKKSKIYFSRKGWYEDVVTPSANAFLSRDIYFPREIRKFIFEEAWNSVVLVEDQQIVDGVSVKWTGSHHRSSMSILLETKNGILSITDSAFTSRNLDENIPIGIAESVLECHEAYRFLKKVSYRIIPAYDPENVRRFKEYLG